MKRCQDCSKLKDGICTRYGKEPPKNYAVKCPHFDGQETQQTKECRHVFEEGLCLRIDHMEGEYWFRPWSRCETCDWR